MSWMTCNAAPWLVPYWVSLTRDPFIVFIPLTHPSPPTTSSAAPPSPPAAPPDQLTPPPPLSRGVGHSPRQPPPLTRAAAVTVDDNPLTDDAPTAASRRPPRSRLCHRSPTLPSRVRIPDRTSPTDNHIQPYGLPPFARRGRALALPRARHVVDFLFPIKVLEK
jgi:hypothetical protein